MPDIFDPVDSERIMGINCEFNSHPIPIGLNFAHCRRIWGLILLTIFLSIIFQPAAAAQDAGIKGQLSAWLTGKPGDNPEAALGLRYIPEVSLAAPLTRSLEVSAEGALAVRGSGSLRPGGETSRDGDINPYRLWVRLASPRFELRAGLQKINFGSASLLRPLRWFDSIDPRDPLKLTDGVYGLLGRYYFMNNANIWMWALIGNEDLKGWETLPGNKKKIEFGGRLQLPVTAGEMGLSFHQREVDPQDGYWAMLYPEQGRFNEKRIGLDGKWDLGIGLWFEGTMTRRDFNVPEARYEKLLTVGLDYTFNIGNGQHLLFEQFMRAESEAAFGSGKCQSVSALTGDYPLSIFDSVSAIVFYDWDRDGWSRFLTWRRTYDQWQIHASIFWNPDQPALTDQSSEITNSYAGNGVQLMLVYNH